MSSSSPTRYLGYLPGLSSVLGAAAEAGRLADAAAEAGRLAGSAATALMASDEPALGWADNGRRVLARPGRRGVLWLAASTARARAATWRVCSCSNLASCR